MSEIVEGMSADLRFVVGDDDTAIALGSGDLPVLATPRLVAWLEAAAVAAVASGVAPDTTTVGGHIAIDHLAPSRVGSTVVAEASVTDVTGRRITFEVAASESGAPIARGRHVRYLVNREQFMG